MKIFDNNLKKNLKRIPFNQNISDVGITKYLPSFAKEWKNTVYSFNKNTIKNIPVNDLNINKIIKSYFDLYFKNRKYTGSKFIYLKRRRNILRRIYVSNAEIKHTNNKAIITLYTVNREKKVLREKYLKINQEINKKLIWKRYANLYRKNIYKIYKILNEHKRKDVYTNISSMKKNSFLKYKLQYLNKFIKLQNLYLKKFWGIIINKYAKKHLLFLKKYDLLYSLNQYKFNKLIFLPILSKILYKIIGKKIEYNIINLKSIAYNTDLFTNALALKLKKRRMNYMNSMLSILNRAYTPSIKDISLTKEIDFLHDKYKDLRIISNIVAPAAVGLEGTAQANIPHSTNIDRLLDGIYPSNIKINNKKSNNNITSSKEIHNIVYNSIKYKNMGGIRLEIKGRLTKRYRADRSIYSLNWKGGLKNIDSSFKGLSSVLFRGNSKSNVTYSMTKSKRRIGAFAVKGWISGK